MEEKKDVGRYSKDNFKGLIRKNGQKWPPERFARMGIYVFLYNRILGKPTKWGLADQDVTIQLKDAIENHWDELIDSYIPEGRIHGIDLRDPKVKEQFKAEAGSYNEYAMEINPNMPSNHEMAHFLEAVSEEKNKYYMDIHASVKEKAGEWDQEGKNNNLIAERTRQYQKINALKHDLNRSTFWTALKGGGTVASGGVTAISAIMLFATPFPLNLVIGLGGGVGGIVGMRTLGSSFISGFRENFRLRQKMRDLKKKAGKKGERGLDEINKLIKYNRGLKEIMDNYSKIRSDGTPPTFEEFVDYIKNNYKFVYQCMKGEVYEGNFKKLYEEAGNHYQSQDGGMLRRVKEYIARHDVSETKNSQIAIEREDLYKAEFNLANGISKMPEHREDNGYPKIERGNPVYTDEHQSLRNWVIWRRKLEDDKETAFKEVPRMYQELSAQANRSFWSVFTDNVFNQEYSSGLQRDLDSYVRENGNEQVLDALKKNPEGDKTNIARNIVAFLGMEARMDGSRALNGDLGVSITSQLVNDKEFHKYVYKVGCEQLYRSLEKENKRIGKEKDYSGEKSLVEEFVNDVQNVLNRSAHTKKELSEILKKVEVSPINDKVKNYLTFMIEGKIDEASLGSNEISDMLIEANEENGVDKSTDIRLLTDNGKYKTITTEISKLTEENLSTNYGKIVDLIAKLDIKLYYNPKTNKLQTESKDRDGKTLQLFNCETGLYNALAKQVESINMKQTNIARAEVLDAMKSGKFNANENLQEIFDKIDEITFEKISNDFKSIDELFQKHIKKASPGIQKYLQMRFSNKIMMVVQDQLKNDSTYTEDKENGMKNLRRDYTKLQGCVYLSLAQKRVLQNDFDRHINLALGAEAIKMQKCLFDGKSSDTIFEYQSKELKQGGYKDYFQRHANDEAAKKYQLYNELLIKQKDLFNFEYGAGKTEISKDASANEIRLITALLTTNDGEKINNPDPDSKDENGLYAVDNIGTMTDDINRLSSKSKLFYTKITALKNLGRIDKATYCAAGFEDSDLKRQYNGIEKFIKDIDIAGVGDDLNGDKKGVDELYNNSTKGGENNRKVRTTLAELLIYKRQIVTAIKGQIRELVENSGDPEAQTQPRNFLMKNTDLRNKLRETWKPIAEKLDRKIDFCKYYLQRQGYNFNGASSEPTMKALSLLENPEEAYNASKSTSGFFGAEMGE